MDGSCMLYYKGTMWQVTDLWVTYDVGIEPVLVAGIDIYQESNDQAIAAFTIDSSSDGSSWVQEGSFHATATQSNLPGDNCGDLTFERFTFYPTWARWWRLNLLSNHGSLKHITFLTFSD